MNKIKFQQFLFGKNHSWSIVAQNLAYQLSKDNDVHLYSTDGYDKKFDIFKLKNSFESSSLKNDQMFDVQISYTAPHNFPFFLANGLKNRFAIWCYEFPIIPSNMIKYFSIPDYILPPSIFAKDSFVSCKVPEDKCKVIPHGIDLEEFKNKNKYKLKTKKAVKFLMPLGQPHLRKGIAETVEAFYKSFTDKDDVCLVAKVPKSSAANHDVNIYVILQELNKKYKQHPEVELITDFVPSMVELYNACDVIYLLTKAEAFFMPGLEGIAANKIILTTNYGGQLDYLNDNNSLLVSGQLQRVNQKALYWNGDFKNVWFEPNIDDAVDKLKFVYQNYDNLISSYRKSYDDILSIYTWEAAANKIKELII